MIPVRFWIAKNQRMGKSLNIHLTFGKVYHILSSIMSHNSKTLKKALKTLSRHKLVSLSERNGKVFVKHKSGDMRTVHVGERAYHDLRRHVAKWGIEI